MDKTAAYMAELARIANDLDKAGKTAEAAKIDEILVKVAAEKEAESEDKEDNGIKVGAKKALIRLRKALKSFTDKDFDSRGPNRRKINKIKDSAEDLLAEIKELVGDAEAPEESE